MVILKLDIFLTKTKKYELKIKQTLMLPIDNYNNPVLTDLQVP